MRMIVARGDVWCNGYVWLCGGCVWWVYLLTVCGGCVWRMCVVGVCGGCVCVSGLTHLYVLDKKCIFSGGVVTKR